MADSALAYKREFAEHEHEIAHIKRFVERFRHDGAFAGEVLADPERSAALARDIGCELDPRLFEALWNPSCAGSTGEELGQRWPHADLWRRYMTAAAEARGHYRTKADPAEHNPSFSAWRHRQIRRLSEELGGAAQGIIHGAVAFELNAGCSIGCWFCGVSAKRISDTFLYTPENRALWRDVLAELGTVLGPALQTGFLYWATDPLDNPDYQKFLEDFSTTAGFVPQTTTAQPLKNVGFTRELLKHYPFADTIVARFSVLTLNQLKRIHSEFSAEELVNVELVYQAKETSVTRAVAGRLFDRVEPEGKAGEAPPKGDPGTIACVSGFLINMCERSIRLITPTRAHAAAKDGYLTLAEGAFSDATELRSRLGEMQRVIASTNVLSDKRATLNPHVSVGRAAESIQLQMSGRVWTLPSDLYGIIAEGEDLPLASLTQRIVSQGGAASEAVAVIRALYQDGFFRDH